MVQAALWGRKRRLNLKKWHSVLYHIDPGAIKHFENRSSIESEDATAASKLRYKACREGKTQKKFYGKGARSPEAMRQVVQNDV